MDYEQGKSMVRFGLMNPLFEELDYCRTRLGELILQRRRVLALEGAEAYEVKLNGEYLMSSLFYEAEVELSRLGLGALSGAQWEVVVGGLGLGYTALAALAFPQVSRLVVVEALEPVIRWHRQGLVPNGAALAGDRRCAFRNADFFALARGDGFDAEEPGHRWDAVLLDIDHTPTQVLNASHADFYSEAGLRRFRQFLKPGGVFALWSNDEPEANFLKTLGNVFEQVEGHVVAFDNPLTQVPSSNVRGQPRPTDRTIRVCSERAGVPSQQLVGRRLEPLVGILGCFPARKVYRTQKCHRNREN